MSLAGGGGLLPQERSSGHRQAGVAVAADEMRQRRSGGTRAVTQCAKRPNADEAKLSRTYVVSRSATVSAVTDAGSAEGASHVRQCDGERRGVHGAGGWRVR